MRWRPSARHGRPATVASIPHQAVPLLAQAMLAQQKFKDLLGELQPNGKDAGAGRAILVARGYAQLGLKDTDDAQASFALAEKTAPNAVEPLLAERQTAGGARRP